MENNIIVGLIAFVGVVLSAIVSWFSSKYQIKTTVKKLYSEFSKQLYSKKLDAYKDIYQLVSSFSKSITKKNVTVSSLRTFYEEFEIFDSKYGLYFSPSTANIFYKLRTEFNSIIQNNDDDLAKIIKSQKMYIIQENHLTKIELALKQELGVFVFHNPLAFEKKEFVNKYPISNNYD